MTRTKQLLAALLSIALVTSVGLVVTGGFAGAQTQDGTASVTIEDQPSDGQTVIVDEVTLPEGGFVVIHDAEDLEGEDDEAGDAVGSVIGVSTYLEAGTHEDVPVTMGQELDTTEVEVTAMAHMDTNGNEVFDFVTSEGELDGAYTTDGAEGTETPAAETPTETPEDETPMETETPDEETPEEATPEDETPEDEAAGDETEEEVAGDFQEETPEDETPEDETPEEETPEDGTATETPEEETPMVTPTETGTPTETPAEGGAGEPVTDTATIDAIGNEVPATNLEFSNQSSDGTTVTVDRVTLYRGGYVVIHNATELEDGDAVGSVVGSSQYMPPGTYEDVEITLAEPVEFEDGEEVNLTAMPHFETNENLVNDFEISLGSEDGPYLQNDSETPVTETAAVSSGDGAATETPEDGTATETPMETPEDGTPEEETPEDETPEDEAAEDEATTTTAEAG